MDEKEFMQAILDELKGMRNEMKGMRSDMNCMRNELDGVKKDLKDFRTEHEEFAVETRTGLTTLFEAVGGLQGDIEEIKNDTGYIAVQSIIKRKTHLK